jgi:hypothetical protein
MNSAAAYWPTRIMLAIGILATAAVVLATRLVIDPLMSDGRETVFGWPSNVVLAAVGVGLPVFGLIWMLRIFRGTRDEPQDWRYRDR